MSAQPLSVLIVEDNPDDARLMLDELAQAGYDPRYLRVDTEPDFLARLDPPPDVVLCDYTLPRFSALRALALLRERCPNTPFLIVSGSIGEETAVEAMKGGADDYLLKDRLGRLGTAVTAAVERRRLREAERRAVEALAASETRHRELVNAIPNVVWMTGPDGRNEFLNRRGVEQLGVTAEAIAGDGWLGHVHPDDVDHTRRQWDAAVATGGPAGYEYRLRMADGGYRWFLAQGVPVRGPTGAVERWVGTSTDIDALKRTEAELRLRDRAIQAASQGVVITDPSRPDNPIVYASPGYERLTGYPIAEVLGKNCRLLQGRDTDPATVAVMREAVRTGRACAVEVLNYRKDGTPFWNAVAIAPVLDGDRLTHFIAVLTDVTERRRLEAQFRQAQKMEAVGQLAGGVAHDFNNLLTVIIGFSDILLSGQMSEPGRKSVQAIREAGERAAGLTAQLLAFSRQSVVEPRVLDLNESIGDIVKLLRRLIGENIALAADLAPDLDPVRADPGQVDQVIMNLAVNARDAMPTGGRLTLATRSVELRSGDPGCDPDCPPGRYVRLSVTDTGTGMTDEVKARIFEPFFTTKGVGKGTGLGLATVYGIVRQAGGHVAVTSQVGAGTTFDILLPAVPDPVPGPETMTPPPMGGTESVLLVEDEEQVRRLARIVLESQGYTVLEAADGVAASTLVAAHTGPLDVLVTDVVMPMMGGRELAEMVRSHWPAVKVLFLSGYTDDMVIRNGGVGVADGFLQKPFTPLALARKVRAVLDGAD